MASQRHRREHNFYRKPYPDSATPGDPTGPILPADVAEENAAQYDETPAWPDADRDDVVPTP